MKKYYFKGCVMLFNQVIARNYEAETYAVSEKKALNNLTYRCKGKMGYVAESKITLHGQLLEV